MQTYLAVRHDGYWAEGFVTLRDEPSAVSRAAFAALARAREKVRVGVAFADLDIAGLVRPFEVHPVVRTAVAPIGLSFDGAAGGVDLIVEGDVISLRAGVTGGADSAIVSAMIAVTGAGPEILWSAA